jgi:peptidyl-prolyl cis-trans isomerase SurA
MKNRPYIKKALCLAISFTAFVSSCWVINCQAQTLFSYGDNNISKDEFLKAYRKNNISGKPTQKTYENYLELYARYKLKVKAAYDLKLDKLPNQVTELQNFRNQIVVSYLNDESSLNSLINEAFDRSQKDIHLAHIFISVPKTYMPADTLKAFNKVTAVYASLKKGSNFFETALEYSEDPFAKNNKGDLGYITVFSLPHELEDLAYKTPVGHFSFIYRSKLGYHIFKNIGERKALGRVRIAQILLAFPPYADDRSRKEVEKRADSIHDALIKGSDFKELTRKFSGDNLTYQTGGEIPEFGIGKYDPAFESAAFALSRDGEISAPVLSSFGYHIIKRLGRKSVSTEKNKETIQALKERVMSDPRIEISKNAMLQKILRLTHYKRFQFNEDNLWRYTDSVLQNKSLPKFQDMDDQTLLFSFSNKEVSVKDWLDFRKAIKNNHSLTTGKTNEDLMDQFLHNTAFDYYRNHAEEYDKDFAYQLNEFKEGNLLFEIMQRQVWDKASSDSLGLEAYYQAHKDKYWWEPGVDAILFTCSNQKLAIDLKEKWSGAPGGWKKWVDSSKGLAQADSGRFEWAQLPVMDRNHQQAGQFTDFVINPTDNTVTIAYLVKIYPGRSPRNFKDARGLAINDYQSFLEDKWIGDLKKTYPLKVNETLLKTLPR